MSINGPTATYLPAKDFHADQDQDTVNYHFDDAQTGEPQTQTPNSSNGTVAIPAGGAAAAAPFVQDRSSSGSTFPAKSLDGSVGKSATGSGSPVANEAALYDMSNYAKEFDIDTAKADLALTPTLYQVMRQTPFLFFAVATAALAGLLFGFDTGIINGVQTMSGWNDEMGITGKSSSAAADLISWIAASLQLAAAFGSIPAGPCSDRIGRKWTIILGCLIVTIGALFQAVSNGLALMIAGRVVEGFAIGILSTIVPMYVSEITPRSVRGTLGTLFQLSITIGILVAFLVNLGLKHANSSWNWRLSLGLQGVLSFCILVLMLFLPESPRWLIAKHKDESAKVVLNRLRTETNIGVRRRQSTAQPSRASENYAESEQNQTGIPMTHNKLDAITEVHGDEEKAQAGEVVTNIDLEMRQVKDEVLFYESQETGTYADLFLRKDMRLRTAIGIALQFMQQLTGINAIFYYSSIIFLDVGLDPDTTTAITGAVNVAATFIAVALMERAGRRSLLLWGAAGMFFCHTVVFSLLYGTDVNTNTQAGNALVVFICLFIVNFAYSWGPICWIVPSEIFPVAVRSKGIAVATMANWLANFAIAKAVPSMILPQNFGLGGTFVFFAAWAAVSFVAVAVFIHETSGVTLEKMDIIFGVSTMKALRAYMWSNTRNLCRSSATIKQKEAEMINHAIAHPGDPTV